MSDKKVLTINPSFFSLNKRATRKKRSGNDSDNTIKIKSATPKKKNDNTLKKKSILKMIRQHQEDRYKTLFEAKKKGIENKPNLVIEELDKGFKDAQIFLQNLAEKKEKEDKVKNYTLKKQPTILDSLSELQNKVTEPTLNIISNASSVPNMNLTMPSYGCLKNGILPTYRNFFNKTRSNQPTITVGGNMNNTTNMSNPIVVESKQPINISMPNLITQSGGNQSIENLSKNNKELAEKKINDSLKRISEMKQTATRLHELKKKTRSIPKRKKTVKRTYKIGKSKVLPRVSVLVSNKTLRNNISTKAQLLKQVEIPEIKRYLIKRGFIKIGSTAPTDVLRKMYEESILMCGEVQNHSPENLLYNFLNSNENL